MNTLVLPSELGRELVKLFDAAPLESGGVLLCRQARGMYDVKLLGSEFLPYKSSDYTRRTPESLTVDPVAVNERIQLAKLDGRSILQVHTHPSSAHARFSPTDDAGEDEMMPVLSRRLPDRFHGALVLGRSSSSVRFYDEDLNRTEGRIVSVGQKIERLDDVRALTSDRFARSYLALGKGGQAALQDMRIGIVGLGGLGSIVAEQLSYLGVGHVVMIDPDKVEETNLNRVVGAVASDVGRYKVEVAAERYAAALPLAKIDLVIGSVIDEKVARAVVDCDMAFCCTDGHGSRALLSWLAYQYLLPVIDVGVEVDVDETIRAIAGRVQLIGPEMPCLHCCESLDANRVREEFMTEEERVRDEYLRGLVVPQPAVVTFNGVAASLATTMMVGIATPLPLAARMQTFNAMTGQVRPAVATPKEQCPFCSRTAAVFGLGDALPGIWRKEAGRGLTRWYRLVSYGPAAQVLTQAEAQAEAQRGGIGLVMVGAVPKMAVFGCPSGCGQTLRINLMRQMGRAWRASVDGSGRLSLSPSIDLVGDCRTHFVMTSSVARVMCAY